MFSPLAAYGVCFYFVCVKLKDIKKKLPLIYTHRMEPSYRTMEECLIHYARKWIVTINTTWS